MSATSLPTSRGKDKVSGNKDKVSGKEGQGHVQGRQRGKDEASGCEKLKKIP